MGRTTAQPAVGRLLRFDQSEALLRKVMESAAVGMLLTGVDGRIIYVNRAFTALLGVTPESCLGENAATLIFEPDREITRLRLARVARGETEEDQVECRLAHRDGSPVWAMTSASLLRSETSARPLHLIIQVIDIGRQKRAEQALADSESRWNHALEAAGQGVWDHDARTGTVFYSRMWRRMRGIPDDEYVDPSRENWLSRVHPDDVARIEANVGRQERGDDGFDILEYRERTRDGRWIWILSRGQPVEWDAAGNPLRSVGTDTDITRFKAAEAALADEKERLRVTLDSIGEGVISTDAEGRVLFMNPVAELLTGTSEKDALGQQLMTIFVACLEQSGQTAPDPVAACLADGCAASLPDDLVLVARDGSVRAILGTAAPVKAEDGRAIGAVLAFTDASVIRAHSRQLEHSAMHDPLTGLPNRAQFGRALDEARRQVVEEQRAHAICFIDLDQFKPVNDSAGHAAGDELLKLVAASIRRSCRHHDFAARLGGDEFVLLLGDCTLGDARRVAQKVVDSIAKLDFAWAGTHFRIGASVGVAAITADPAIDPLERADAACYAAKANGRGRVMVDL